MAQSESTTHEGTDSKDEFARELGYDGYDDLPPQVRRNVDACWPNVRVGSFGDLLSEATDRMEGSR